MKEEWKKYSYAGWGYKDSFEKSYFPDSFMERMHTFLTPYMKNAAAYFDGYEGAWNHPDTINTDVDWETSKQQTRAVLKKLSPKYAQIFDDAFERNRVDVTKVKAGNGGGWCSEKGIGYRRDGTINDAIYLTHEFGHYIAIDIGNHDQPALINEWQGFFMQYAQLDDLINNKAWGEDIANTTKNHQKLDLSLMLKYFPDRLRVLEDLKNGKIKESDIAETHHYTEQPHYHGTAAFIALALFNKYQNASPKEQQRLLHSLFETTADTSYESVLEDFDLLDAGKLEHSISEALKVAGLKTATPNAPSQKITPKP